MNKLELCQKIREKCAITGLGPVSVVGQSGEMLRLVNWFDEAWNEIQSRREDWSFLRVKDSSIVSVAGSQLIALPSDFAHPISLTIDDTTSRYELAFKELHDFEELYRTTYFSSGRPSIWTIDGNNIKMNAEADQAYSMTLSYFKEPVVLTENTDVPAIKERYQWIIIYKVMQLYGLYDNAQEVLAEGMKGYNQMLNLLELEYLPNIERPRALA